MQKVLVIGCPGAGKSTFARALRDATGLPLCYLDMLWHKPDRTNVTPEAFDRALAEWLARPAWIIDGNYSRTLPTRLAACDTVFFLDYPLNVCLAGAEGRIGQVREDMPWVETEWDPEFRQYILDFGRDQCPRMLRLVFRIGQDHHGSGRISGSLDNLQICLYQHISFMDHIPVRNFLGKTFSFQLYCIDSYMDQQFSPCFCGKAHRMSGFKNIADLSVAGCGDLPL